MYTRLRPIKKQQCRSVRGHKKRKSYQTFVAVMPLVIGVNSEGGEGGSQRNFEQQHDAEGVI